MECNLFQNHLLKRFYFLYWVTFLPLQLSFSAICVGLLLHCVLSSIDLCEYSSVNTTISWSLWFANIFLRIFICNFLRVWRVCCFFFVFVFFVCFLSLYCFLWFGYQGYPDLIGWERKCFILFYFLKEIVKNWCYFFLTFLKEFVPETTGIYHFLLRKNCAYNLHLLNGFIQFV